MIKINLIIYDTFNTNLKVGGYYKERKKERKKEGKQVSEDDVMEVGFGFTMEILVAKPKSARCVENHCNLLITVDNLKLDLLMYLPCV